MADGIESFDEKRNLARISAGLGAGGPFNSTPSLAAPKTFVKAWPEESQKKYAPNAEDNGGTPLDPWVYRRNNAKM